ncbi:intraflagellar transport protein 22 homolog isoform 3-T3 [Guaruba guarouba]
MERDQRAWVKTPCTALWCGFGALTSQGIFTFCQSGKSVLANFISENTEGIGSYSPTQGLRFETCWPALMKDSHGVIIIFNPELPSHLKEIEMWYSCFVQQQSLLDSQCLLVAHHKPGSGGDTEDLSLAYPLNRLKLIHSNLEEDPEDVRMEFIKYFKSIITLINESREREEMSIIS